jgi:hypothetical protein
MDFPDPRIEIVKFGGTIYSRMILSDATLLLIASKQHLRVPTISTNQIQHFHQP